MIKRVIVTNYVGDTLTLELSNPWESGFVIQSITGITPAKANIEVTEIVTADGAIYNSSRLESRNIVIALAFLENPTIEEVRHLSYKYFPVKKPIKMVFETDTRVSEIEGYVESNEINIFSKQEGCQISIICPDPNFYSETVEHTMYSVADPLFHFPFSNEGLNVKTIVFGEVWAIKQDLIYYEGDEDIGLTFVIDANGPATNVNIYNSLSNKYISIDTDKLASLTGNGIIAGDRITICTIKGKKSVTLLRSGVTTNILNCINRDAEWFQLISGDNIFMFTADSGIDNLNFTTLHQLVYEGV